MRIALIKDMVGRCQSAKEVSPSTLRSYRITLAKGWKLKREFRRSTQLPSWKAILTSNVLLGRNEGGHISMHPLLICFMVVQLLSIPSRSWAWNSLEHIGPRSGRKSYFRVKERTEKEQGNLEILFETETLSNYSGYFSNSTFSSRTQQE